MNLINLDLESNKEPSKLVKRLSLSLLIFLIILYVGIAQVQSVVLGLTSHYALINGILAQLQVIILLILVMLYLRRGVIISYILNILNLLRLIAAFIFLKNVSVVPGIATCLCSIVSIIIMGFLLKRLNERSNSLRKQNDYLMTLYEKVASSEKKLVNQNKQLLTYNTALKEQEEELHRMAFHDSLTGLPNRRSFFNIVDNLINREDGTSTPFSIAYIDVDNFKKINDSLGHSIGDIIITEICSRFSRILDSQDTLSRLGGDKFALVISRDLTKDEISDYLSKFVNTIIKPFSYDDTDFYITLSIGVAQMPQDAAQAEALIKAAETAMYGAKDSGGNDIHFFHVEMQESILKRIEVESRLRNALENNELYLVYQPQFYADTKKLRGFETLIRWNSPELGNVPPYKFIPILEETGEIVSIGKWILETACRDYLRVRDCFETPPTISINISAVQLRHKSFLSMVSDIILDSRINPSNLEFEVTESVLISSRGQAADVLDKLHHMGIKIALDDFGTGYSSLSYLQDFTFDVLKIDKSFIDKISAGSSEKAIVPGIIQLAKQLGLDVVAEGVEEEYQLSYLQQHECNYIQGFIWGHPSKYEDLLENVEIAKLNK